ncbi:MAG: hypothetical protein HN352_12835 [Bacteroidetes bacterium]|mgnify:FL=1|jgi:hypothetical protein|nr:hypothetical protein [Bacteroidota bacterium]MBT3749075.1 hypothetical protein [Bacteroidota bacterium]MBT4400943.1 hypothetical protein [Bacteroidota bacterium]MBT4408943.1 hypothetical protein [Bacteroidota bacterium]MBT5424673.1 hypothetical protein [Bacteroidota bacterium]
MTKPEQIDPLHNQDSEIFLREVDSIRQSGSLDDLSRIINALHYQKEHLNKKALTDLLADIKHEKMTEILIEAMKDEKNNAILADLTQICWESNLNFTEHLPFFANIFLNQQYLVALEAFSVIENTFLDQTVTDEIRDELVESIKNGLSGLSEHTKLLAVDLIHVIQE